MRKRPLTLGVIAASALSLATVTSSQANNCNRTRHECGYDEVALTPANDKDAQEAVILRLGGQVLNSYKADTD